MKTERKSVHIRARVWPKKTFEPSHVETAKQDIVSQTINVRLYPHESNMYEEINGRTTCRSVQEERQNLVDSRLNLGYIDVLGRALAAKRGGM